MGKSVCMFVYNNCATDARVLKEAASLVKEGYQVKIIAVLDKTVSPYEVRDGIEIFRVIKNPFHYRLFKGGMLLNLFRPKEKVSFKTLRNGGNKPKKKIKEKEWLVPPKNRFLREVFISFKLLYKSIFYLFRFISRILKVIIVLPSRPMLMIIHKPLCFYDFYKRSLVLNKEEPSDIYHGHDLHTVPTAYKTAKRTNSKVVYDAHELYTEMSALKPLERKYYTIFEKKYAPKVDALITVNESIANELVERYKLKKRPYIIYNCPEVNSNITLNDKDVLRERLSLPLETKIVLYQGGFSVNRGLFNLIQSAQYINDDAKVVFMGWGRIESELRDEVDKLKLENKVLFTPGVPQNELLNNTKSANVGVIPYQFVGLNNYYTSPNKLFEYINANVPIAGSNFPELKRVIGKYNIGETFDPESPESIAESINKILENTPYFEQLKENTKFAAKDFTWEKEEKKLIKIYQSLSEQ